MRKGGAVLNFARGPIVDERGRAGGDSTADSWQPTSATSRPTRSRHHPRVVTLPHLGASTGEAEENCAIMVADSCATSWRAATSGNSVNFPEGSCRARGVSRLAIANANVPNMVGQISTCLAEARLNIADLLNKSRGELAYTLIDTDARNRARSCG